VSTLISAFTPELLRNGRIQLRQGRIVSAVVICAAISLSAVAYFFYSPNAAPAEMAALDLVRTMVILQIAVLLIGGGIYCLQSVNREKEFNTFDYQRITRLKPIELAIGKVLGAPALTYLIVLCLMPVTLVATFVAQMPVWTLAQIYLILLLGSITFHLLALLLSLLVPRGSSAGSSLFFLFLIGMGSMFGAGVSTFAIHQVSPFYAVELLSSQPPRNVFAALPPRQDLFLGISVPHVLVLLILYVTFSAFFLLAVTRNIKRDPSVYEIFSPWQALGFVLYLNALALGFFRWTTPVFIRTGVQLQPTSASAAELTLMGMALWLFAIFGFALLRNRERVRRRIRQHGAEAAGWWAAMWPSPYLAGGALVTGLAILAMIRFKVEEYGNWSLNVGALEVAFFTLWLARDLQYLQWMNLRKGRRPLVAGVLYLVIFYVCVSTLMVAFGLYKPIGAPYRAIFTPSAAFGLDADAWMDAARLWLRALLLLVIETFVFVWLQRRELEALANPLPENRS
jgi:hypothetical protein